MISNHSKLINHAKSKRRLSREEDKQDPNRFRWGSSVPEAWHRFMGVKPPQTASPVSRVNLNKRAATANPTRSRERNIGLKEYEENLMKLNKDVSDDNLKYHQLYQFTEEQPREILKPEPTRELQSPSYSIKYLGITNGQIGILSKRTPIPQLSPLESCKDVPLPLIYSTSKDMRQTNSIINQIIDSRPNSKSNTRIDYKPNEINYISPVVHLSKKVESDVVIDESLYPNPDAYNKHVIHTYARPRGLVAHQKQFSDADEVIDVETFNSKFLQLKKRFDLNKQRPVETPVFRTGVTG